MSATYGGGTSITVVAILFCNTHGSRESRIVSVRLPVPSPCQYSDEAYDPYSKNTLVVVVVVVVVVSLVMLVLLLLCCWVCCVVVLLCCWVAVLLRCCVAVLCCGGSLCVAVSFCV